MRVGQGVVERKTRTVCQMSGERGGGGGEVHTKRALPNGNITNNSHKPDTHKNVHDTIVRCNSGNCNLDYCFAKYTAEMVKMNACRCRSVLVLLPFVAGLFYVPLLLLLLLLPMPPRLEHSADDDAAAAAGAFTFAAFMLRSQ